MDTFTIIDDGRAHRVSAVVDGDRIAISPDDLHAALGWEVSPDGLCREGLCVPVPSDSRLVRGDASIDLAELAAVLGRPLAVDVAERAAYLGVAPDERARALRSRVAPDFTLPDLQGRRHSLAEHRGKKVLLVAYASW